MCTYIPSKTVFTLDLVVDTFEKVGNRFVIADLYELDPNLIFVCAEAVKIFRGIDDDLFNIFKRSFGSTISKDDQIEARIISSLTSIERRKGFHELIKVPLESLIRRRITSGSETAEFSQLLDPGYVLFRFRRIEEMDFQSSPRSKDEICAFNESMSSVAPGGDPKFGHIFHRG